MVAEDKLKERKEGKEVRLPRGGFLKGGPGFDFKFQGDAKKMSEK